MKIVSIQQIRVRILKMICIGNNIFSLWNSRTPEGLEDVSMYPNLFVELAGNPGWSNEDLKKVAGENFLRVFREAEHVRNIHLLSFIISSHYFVSQRETNLKNFSANNKLSIVLLVTSTVLKSCILITITFICPCMKISMGKYHRLDQKIFINK